MMSSFASSARAMKLRCASPLSASNRPMAHLPGRRPSSLITGRGRQDCSLRLPCHEDRTGAAGAVGEPDPCDQPHRLTSRSRSNSRTLAGRAGRRAPAPPRPAPRSNRCRRGVHPASWPPTSPISGSTTSAESCCARRASPTRAETSTATPFPRKAKSGATTPTPNSHIPLGRTGPCTSGQATASTARHERGERQPGDGHRGHDRGQALAEQQLGRAHRRGQQRLQRAALLLPRHALRRDEDGDEHRHEQEDAEPVGHQLVDHEAHRVAFSDSVGS